MIRSEAIKKKCLECSGDSHKEVTLCPVLDCPLWPYRTGRHIRTKSYKERIRKAKKRYSNDFEEMRKEGIDVSKF